MLRRVAVSNDPIHSKLEGLTFSLYSAEEIKKLSVVNIITPLSFNALGHPLPGGLYDPAMGPYDQGGLCATCQQTFQYCPGHFGRIELPLPVINPLFSKTMLLMCRLSCLECHNTIIPGLIKYLTITQMKLLNDGLLEEAQEAEYIIADILHMEETENAPTKSIRRGGGRPKARNENPERVLQAKMRCEEHLRNVYAGKDTQKFRAKLSTNTSKNLETLKRAVLKRAFGCAKSAHTCTNCGMKCRKLMMFESKIIYSFAGGAVAEETAEDLLDNTRSNRFPKAGPQKYLTPAEAMDHLRKVWANEPELMQTLFPVLKTTTAEHPTDLFFIQVVGVPPPKNRAAQMLNNQMVEHPQNIALRHVVTSCTMLNYASIALNKGEEFLSTEASRALKGINGGSLPEKLENIWNELQADIVHLLDREQSRISAATASSMMGLKQVIEKKEGLFRMHMMGKRVNYAARTVITPDPNIDTEEIGIPDVFAKVLTFPTPVTPWNVHMLQKMVNNGPNVHPGATAVEDFYGNVVRLDPNNPNQRASQANLLLKPSDAPGAFTSGVKTVYRHLINGDYLLLNRQPSLHRPSIMAHRARVLYGDKVFRLHYANCKHYNADFDGDEMNAHFPQSHVARSEAASLVNVCSHFLVPKDGTPLAGLIQDHIVAAVRLTVRGRFFSRNDYMQLVYFGLSNYTRAIETEPPAIIKPVPLWSGKQVISTVIRNLCPAGKQPLTLTSNTKIKGDEWRREPAHPAKAGGPINGDDLSESVVIFRHGYLLTGILDKVSLGATPFGLCHAFYELYGSQSAGALLSSFSRLMTNFLQWEGFTLGVKDVLVQHKADKLRRQCMEEAASQVGHVAAALGVSLTPEADPETVREKLEEVHRSRDPKKRAFVDLCYKKQLDQYNNKINKACLPNGLVEVFPNNNLQLLVQSGAKGSTVNTMQMSCALGQIELEGKRPPMTMSGKTLPSFRAYDVSPRAGGFIAGRFLTGIRPQEFFFHCMAGREGLIDTAVKTSRSGYLQRCLVKLLEGVVVQYDGTVRDSDGSMIQYLYGEDGLDVGKAQYLKAKQLKFLEENVESIIDEQVLQRMNTLGNQKKLNNCKKKISKWVKANGSPTTKIRRGGFLNFCAQHAHEVEGSGINPDTGRTYQAETLAEMWRGLSPQQKEEYEQDCGRCPDPVISKYRPDCNYTAVSESMDNLMRNVRKAGQLTDSLETVVHYKALKSLSSPGDAVGVLAAQSIGEPSTQMTLNTFHFAGRGEMNVTLGIPRLREILMVASANIKTPSMDIPFLPGVTEKQAEKLRLQLTKVTLAQVLEKVEVREQIDIKYRVRVNKLKFVFLKKSQYAKEFCVKPKHIMKYVESRFMKKLCGALQRVKGKKNKEEDIEVEREGGRGRVRGGGGESDDDNDNNGGRSNDQDNLRTEREKKGTGEEHESSDEEEEMDDADATQANRRARHTERDYDAPEDEEIMVERDDFNDNEENEENKRDKPSSDDDGEDEDDSGTARVVSRADYNCRAATVRSSHAYIQSYDFDQENEEWCIVEIHLPLGGEKVNMASKIKEVAGKSVVHQTPFISRAFIVRNGDNLSLKTEGINILAMAEHRNLLDIDRLHCNNIHTMAERYGIEAASRVIVKEMTDVFKVYGIVIDPRHLTLIGDYMTFSGSYRPFNRIGIETSASPLQQMSFETVVGFLREATLCGKRDDLSNPSARLVVGKPAAVGTGLFGLRTQIKPFRVKN